MRALAKEFKGIKKYTKITVWIVVVIIILLFISYSGLRSPKVQTFLTQNLAQTLSKQLNTEVTIKGVDIDWLKTIVLEGVLVKDLHKDTLLYVKELGVDIQKYKLDSNYFKLGNVELNGVDFYLKKYSSEEDLNLQFVIDHFSTGDTTSTRYLIYGDKLLLTDVHFKFENQDREQTDQEGINFEDLEIFIPQAKFNEMSVVGDKIAANINEIQLKDKSGFEIKNLSALTSISSKDASLENLALETNNSLIDGSLKFSYSDYGDYADFINKIHIDSKLQNTRLNISDIAWFAPVLWGVDQEYLVNGDLYGNVNSFKFNNLKVNFSNQTEISGNLVMSGLPDFENTFIHFDDIKAVTHCSDIQRVQLPPYNEKRYLELPPEVQRLGILDFSGEYKGMISEFELNGELITELGKAGTEIQFTQSQETGFKQYDGRVYAKSFDIGTLLAVTEVGKVSMDFDVNGYGVEVKDSQVNLLGEVQSIELMNYDYKNIVLEGDVTNGTFNGFTEINDTNAYVRFDGVVDFAKTVPEFQFVATIQNANLSNLNLAADTCGCMLSTFITSDFKGTTLDDIEGQIGVFQTEYAQNGHNLVVQDFELIASKDTATRSIELISDMINGKVQGVFLTEDLSKSVFHAMAQSFPAMFDKEPEAPGEIHFDYSFLVSDIDSAAAIFMPGISLPAPILVEGRLDSRDSTFRLTANSAEVKYNDVHVTDLTVKSAMNRNIIETNLISERILIGDSLEVKNYEFVTKGLNDLVQFKMNFDNEDQQKNYANLGGMLWIESASKFKFGFSNSDLSIDGFHWMFKDQNMIEIDTTSITVQNFQLYNDSQVIMAVGKITEDPNDKIMLFLQDIDLAKLDRLYSGVGLTLEGIVNGNAVISDPYKEFIFSTDINVSELVINNEELGQANLSANLLKNQQAIKTRGNLGGQFDYSGFYYPKREVDNLDLILNLNNLSLHKFEPFVEGILSDVSGDLSGRVTIKGTPDDPKFRGTLNLVNAGLTVDYLNTHYTLKDEFITIEEDWFGFDIITVEDRHGGIATATGTIVHEKFKNLNFDIAVFPEYFECLNTTAVHNPMYYGNAYASGVISVSGYAETMHLDISVRTEKGTDFYLPLDGAQEHTSKDYIKFIVKDSTLAKEEEYKVNLDGMEMVFDLEVTPDAKMQIIFDEQVGDIIKTQGQGQIKMEISPTGDFSIYGNYEITDGDYLFTLENIINKRFTVKPGSSISFDGDPTEALLDVTAIYSLKAPLKDLGISDVDTSGKKIPVDCHLIMQESLSKPTLSFDLDLPNSSDNTNSTVKSAIASNGSMNKQVFSLLLINRFVPVTDRGGFSAGGAGTASSSELLSNQLSNWLSQMSDDFDIGFNYSPGDEVSSSEVEVALSTQLFNDRVTVETNVGVTNDNSNSSSIAGDFDLEYKISKDGKVKGRVYNESNDVNDVSTNNVKYTQGVGIAYTEEFNTFGEFFRKLFNGGKNE